METNSKKAVVTGGAGFIGSHVVEELLGMGWEVLVIDNFSTNPNTLAFSDDPYRSFMEGLSENPKFLGLIETDLSIQGADKVLRHLFYGFDYVFHLAASPRVQPSIDDPMTYHKLNVDSTVNVLEAARLSGIKKVIFSSSSSIYGNPHIVPTNEEHAKKPMSPYGLHKQIGEEYCKLYSLLYGLKTVCLRYMNVFGERQPTEGAYVPVVGIWFRQHFNAEAKTITGDGTQTRDFIYVKDVAKANIMAALNDKLDIHEYFNVGSGKNYELNEIASWYNSAQESVHVKKRFEPHTTQADISKIRSKLGWQPSVDLKDYIESKVQKEMTYKNGL